MFRFPTVSALCVFGAAAQFSGGADQTNVRGHVLSDQSLSESYVVELHPLSGGMNKPHALTNAAGDFQLSGVDSGDYWLIVTDRQGRTVYQQLQHVDKSAAPLEVRLPSVANPKPPSGSVTIASLRHKVPRQAVHEYKAAVAARKHADREAALAHLLKAVELDPQFAEAHNDIAAQYIEGKRYDNALEELDKAAALDPASTVIELNRAACLSKMGRLAEAETSARRSMQLDGGSRRSRYLLGIILATQKKFTPEAIDDLERSSDEFPEARVTVAQILVRVGRNAEAREQLSRFLRGCNGEKCQPVQMWLDRLNGTGQ